MTQPVGFTRDYRNQCIEQGKAGDATLKIEELIGEEGLALYHAALQEECASFAFIEATVKNNAFERKGARFKTAGNVFVFGRASGIGKTFQEDL